MTDIKTARSTTTRLPRAVYVISAIVFVLGTSEFGIAGLLPEIAADMDVTVPRAGLLISAYAIAMVVGAPLLTLLSLRLPPRATLLSALGIFIVGQVVGALAGDYYTLLVARVVAAGATGAFWAAAAAVVVDAAGPARRARALAAQMGGLTLANVLGVPLGTLVGQQYGWRATFWILAGGAAIAAVVITRLVAASERSALQSGIRGELRVFADKRIWLTLGTIAAFQTAVMSCFSYLAPLVTDVAELSADLVPVALAIFGIGSLVGVQVGGRLADAHLRGTTYLGLGAIVGVLLVLVVGGSVPAIMLASALVLGGAAFIGAAALQARLFSQASAAPRLAGAISASAFNVGATFGPWLGGLTISAGWGYRAPSGIGAVLAVVALVVSFLARS